MIKPEASDTTPDAAEVQRRIVAAMTGLERIRAVGRMFTGMHRLLSMRYENPVDVLRHLHGDSISEADYAAIAQRLRRKA